MTRFAPETDRDPNNPKRISGALASRSSMIANMASRTAATPSSDSVVVLPQGWFWVPTIA
jgi:hypothetical protein